MSILKGRADLQRSPAISFVTTSDLNSRIVSWLEEVRSELEAPSVGDKGAGKEHPLLGYSLEGAQLGRILGVGSFAVVFELHDPADSGRQLAVKVLRRSTIGRKSEQENESFRREVDIGMRLEHPSITRIHRFSERAQTRFVVLDKVDGETLRAVKGTLSLDR